MGGFLQDLIVVSGLTISGMINLVATIARIVSQGEDRKDWTQVLVRCYRVSQSEAMKNNENNNR